MGLVCSSNASSGVALQALPLAKSDPKPQVEPSNENLLDLMIRRVDLQFKAALGFPPHRKIGTHDSFFTLGGDSLSAIKLVVGLRESLGRTRLGLQEVVAAPTVHGLSELLLLPHLQANTDTDTDVDLGTSTGAASISISIDASPAPAPDAAASGSPSAEQLQQLQRRLAALGPAGAPSRMQVMCLNPGNIGHAPLVLLNPAGASALAYMQLAGRLAAAHPCTPVFGMDDGCILNAAGWDLQYPFHTITDVVLACEPVVAEIARLYCPLERGGGQRVALAGWSWGGTVAVALACHLTRRYSEAAAQLKEGDTLQVPQLISLTVIDGPITRTPRFEQYAQQGAEIILATKRNLAATDSRVPPVDAGMAQRTVAHYAACTRLMSAFYDSSAAVLHGSGAVAGEQLPLPPPLQCRLLDIRPQGLTEDSAQMAALTSGPYSQQVLRDPSHFTMITGPSAEEAARAMATAGAAGIVQTGREEEEREKGEGGK